MPPRKRGAAESTMSSNHVGAGPSTRIDPPAKRVKAEPSLTESPLPIESRADQGNRALIPAPAPPLIGSLSLHGTNLRSVDDAEKIIVSEVLLFPSTLQCLKPSSDAIFSINCTPSEYPEVPLRVTRAIHNKHYGHVLPPVNTPRYIHIGRTNILGFPLHFYVMMAGFPARWHNYPMPWPREQYRDWFDHTMIPALRRRTAMKKYGIHWGEWSDYEASFSAASKHRGYGVPIEHNLPVAAIQQLWYDLNKVDHGRYLKDAVLFAYGDMHDNPAETETEWHDFAKAWAQHIEANHLGSGSKVTPSISLDVQG